MILELAIGDAYGAGFEFVDKKIIIENNNLEYFQHPIHDIKKGYYTDDTQMSIAIAELMVNNIEFTPLNIASKFVEVFKRDVRNGYAGGFYDFLRSINSGEEFLNKIKPDSVKNGACMRAVPLGLYSDYKEVIRKSTIQAQVTHNTPIGINSSVAVSLLAYFFKYEISYKENMIPFITKYTKGDWNIPYYEEVSGNGEITVRAVITILNKCNTLSEILYESIKLGGDVDSVASIAMGIASLSDMFVKDIPDILFYNLEMTKYGRIYLEELDKKLQ